MTIGENIQKRRKSLGLSQEELGQKLLVSRQTVSLWEKDETVPTIDNLLRLKELFGVSVDELLGVEDKIQTEDAAPKEAYQFQFSEAEWKQIENFQLKIVYKRTVISAMVYLLFFVFFLIAPELRAACAFPLGVFLVLAVSCFKGIRRDRKTLKASMKKRCETLYEYRVFENYMILNLYRNGEKIRESKSYFTDIEKIYAGGQWLLLQMGGQYFVVRKSDLKEDSAFYSFMYWNPPKVESHDASNKWRAVSIFLLVASILSIFGGLIAVNPGVTGNPAEEMIKNMWRFFLLTPIPIGSIVFGFVMKSKGYKYKKNVVVGIIMTILLCIYGSFTFIF